MPTKKRLSRLAYLLLECVATCLFAGLPCSLGLGLGRLRGVNSLELADGPPTPLVRSNLDTVLADVKAFALVSEE